MPTPRSWMAAALAEAGKGLGETSPNPAVGAVIIKNGRIVARGFHRRFGGPHAEIEAIHHARAKKIDLRGSCIAVTLEPCDHFGKTPPCTQAIRAAGIQRVLVGMLDPHSIVAGRGVRKLRRAGVLVEVLDDPAVRQFYLPYLTFHRRKRSFVTLKLAVSTDGKIAGAKPGWITGPAAREEVQRIRQKVDAILVGRKTAVVDNPRLTLRPPFALGRSRMPRRIILSATGNVPKQLRLFQDTGAWIAKDIAPRRLVRRLAREGVIHLLVEGGAQTARSFLVCGVVDEIRLFVSPKILGGLALDAFRSSRLRIPPRGWRLVDVTPFGRDMLLSFQPNLRSN